MILQVAPQIEVIYIYIQVIGNASDHFMKKTV